MDNVGAETLSSPLQDPSGWPDNQTDGGLTSRRKTNRSLITREGLQVRPPQQGPLRRGSYLELKAIETLRAHERFSPLPERTHIGGLAHTKSYRQG